MSVGIKVGSIIDEIGTSDFLHSFFSTASSNLETNGWGSRFPHVMKTLYEGRVATEDISKTIEELKTIRTELAAFPPTTVVWDIGSPAALPPWGNNISPEITSLANYFVTSTGRDLFEVFLEALEAATQEGKVAEIVKY